MDEDFDFTAPSVTRSRLSSLFQGETTASGDVNQALTFTAPKQPKKNDNTQGASGALKLIHAAVVHTYKLKDGNYTKQGKLGCAVLGHHETSTYKLLLYKGNSIQVNIVTITPNFLFHVQPNNYANFYDVKKENWSINFESEATLFDFTKQVSLAKANSQGKCVTTLVMQDLVKGEGQPLENGDAAEVKYTGWLLSNFTFGQVFDSNMNSDSLFRVRLGKGKVIKGWNEGLLGMQKGGKRILIVPSNLAYGSEGMGSTVPPNSILIFEIHVVKIKFARESSHSPSPVKVFDGTTDKKPEVPPRQSFSQDDNIRLRGASISEQLSQSPKRDKAQLISRMAKMGTATLPFQGAIPAQVSSDSESEVDALQRASPAPSISRTSSPKGFNKSRSRTNSGTVISSSPIQLQPVQDAIPFHASQPSNHMSLYAQSSMPSHQPFVCAATPFPSYQHQMQGQFSVPQSAYSVPSIPGMIPSVPTSIADSHLNLMITETRNQNTEIRMGLSKIMDKVDTVIQKVDDLNFHGKGGVNINLPFMENVGILQNIERIIQENTHLKEDVEAKGSKIQSLNEIICDLFQRNPRFSEESNGILEQKIETLQMASSQSQEKISSLEEESLKLQLELSTATSKLQALDADVLKYQKLEIELNQKVLDEQKESKQQKELLNETKEKINDNQILLSSLQEKLKAVEHEKDLLNMKLQSIEEKHTKTQGSSDLVEIYKKEIQEYKEKIEELNSVLKDSISSTKLEEEKHKIKVELAENIKLKEETESKVKDMEKKINSYEELKLTYEDKIRSLEHEVEHSQLLKKKFEVFQEKTRTLKETYEKQIVELVNEVRHLQNMKSEMSPEFSVEIKKVMNRLYKLLQAKFEPNTSYLGSQVLETMLKAIMGLTLQILENKKQPAGDHSDTTESSEKEVSQKQKVHDQKEAQQNVFSQQNGVNDFKTDVTVVSEGLDANSDLSNVDQLNESSEVQLETVKELKETMPSEKEEKIDTSVKQDIAGSSESMDESNAQAGETDRIESPEIWRPQPPPLFDDDDDDDDDDDWLK